MTTGGVAAYGTLLLRGDADTPEVFTEIAEVTNISGPNWALDALDMTSHSSSGDREFVGGLIDGGEITLECNFIPTDTTQGFDGGVLEDLTTRTQHNYQLQFSDSIADPTIYEFVAFPTAFEPSGVVDGKLSASVTFKVTGAISEQA